MSPEHYVDFEAQPLTLPRKVVKPKNPKYQLKVRGTYFLTGDLYNEFEDITEAANGQQPFRPTNQDLLEKIMGEVREARDVYFPSFMLNKEEIEVKRNEKRRILHNFVKDNTNLAATPEYDRKMDEFIYSHDDADYVSKTALAEGDTLLAFKALIKKYNLDKDQSLEDEMVGAYMAGQLDARFETEMRELVKARVNALRSANVRNERI